MSEHQLAHLVAAYARELERGEDLTGAELARILTLLAAHEVEEGGPYAFSPAAGSEEADLGLNLAVAVFLAGCDVRLPKLDAFLESRLEEGERSSRVFDAPAMAHLEEAYRRQAQEPQERDGASYTASEAAMLERIRDAARERFKELPGAYAARAEAVIERTIRGNPDKQMSLMALSMREALGGEGNDFDDEFIARLGLANVFFWTAFIIYDDFWDEDEAADPGLLPVANLFAREYTDFFSSLLPGSGFRAFFHALMDKLDAANAWEIAACRMRREGRVVRLPERMPEYGDYGIKFYPAGGHVMGPVAMLVASGRPVDSSAAADLVEYFKHYLVAMQLNDDTHDWKEDLERGHISTAVAELLRAWRARHPERDEIRLDEDMPELERLFWFEALDPLCAAILSHTEKARRALGRLSFLAHPAPLEAFIDRNEQSAYEAMRERERGDAFLAAMAA